MKTIFRIVSLLEGVSYLLLLLGTVYKYTQGNESLVKLFGMPHGVLFIAYIILAFLIKSEMKWNIKTLAIVLIASVLPFGTFYIEGRYFKKKN
jgi:integral membrane protein